MEIKLKSTLLCCFNDRFKEKKARMLIKRLTQTHPYLTFNNYGEMTYEDNDSHRHEFPIVIPLDNGFERRCNCVIFNIDKNYYKNKYGYTKMIVYYHEGNNFSNYGLYFYNEDNGKCTHNYELSYEDDELSINITRNFNTWEHREMLEYYLNRKI